MAPKLKETLKIYLCGPTVYGEVHIGNLRSVMLFDLLIRAKRVLGFEVVYLHNITDVDDKIRERAINEGKSESELADFFAKDYENLLTLFNIQKPTYLPRIRENIDSIFELINDLLEIGMAYQVGSGIYFDISKQPLYGKLSNRSLASSIDFSNRAMNGRFSEYLEEFKDKRNKQDFALWKFNVPGDNWTFKNLQGRPGWHTECASLINNFFGGNCDIHGGGIDLLFPHHENENIQILALHGKPISKQWIHVAHLQLEGKKMSKSVGNICLARDFFKKYGSDIFRFLLLLTRYQNPLNLNQDVIKQCQVFLRKFKLLHNKFWLFNDNFLNLSEDVKDDQDLKVLFNLVASLNFSKLMINLNLLYKNAEKKDQKSNKILTYFFREMGFEFAKKIPTQADKILFLRWQELLKKQEFFLADKERIILAEKGLI